MLSMEFIRKNPAKVRRAIEVKGVSLDMADLIQVDSRVRAITKRLEDQRAKKNELTEKIKKAATNKDIHGSTSQAGVMSFSAFIDTDLGILRKDSKELGTQISNLEQELSVEKQHLKDLLLRVPNIPYPHAPVGPDETFNRIIRREGELPRFNFEPLDHVALLEKNDWADLSRITQVSGSRTYCLKGRLALLESKLMAWALDRIANAGFTAITVPAIAREDAFLNQGQFPSHKEETYELPNDELWLAGTAEVALTSLHSGEVIEGDKLPILYAGYSPCFRREAGSAGKDVRGLLRVHQFVKVEQYVICEADKEQSAKWHARLLELAESLLKALEIPYQVIETSTGDMGLGKYRMNDIESWVPSLGKYRETHSCSTLHDWQARRANLRYRGSDGKVRFAHTLNNTALASPRILVPLLENHQTEDGRVRLPKALQELMGGEYL